MLYFLYFLLPCLALAVIVVVLEILTPIFKRNREKEIEKAKIKWTHFISKKEDRIKKSKRAVKYLSNPAYLIAFSQLLDSNKDVCKQIIEENYLQIYRSFIKQKDNVQCGFFAHILSRFDLSDLSDDVKDLLYNLMFSFSRRKSVYCHENALRVFYKFGRTDYIVKSFDYFSKKQIQHNEKLITDGLCSFSGDKTELADNLIENKSAFSIHYQISIVNFLAIQNIYKYDSLFQKELTEEIDLDYRCSILRLLSKQKSEINRAILLAELKDFDFSVNWEPAAVAANGLALYPNDEDIMKELSKACCSPHWSVRINSANSLTKIDEKKSYIQKVLDGEDAFAKDAINYALTSQEGMPK